MSRFYFGDSTSSSEDGDDDLHTLPFATPLPRSDFLTPRFSPSAYLSTLSNRHQTLEDLRSELRARSQLLSKELLDLVNSNYQDFLNLGNSLHGGEEKIEEVRVGLLGFRKEVESLRAAVRDREKEVGELVQERRDVRKQIQLGQRLIDYDMRLKEIETELDVEIHDKKAMILDDDVSDSDEDDDDEEDEDEGNHGISIMKLKKNFVQYRLIQELQKGLADHPFILAQAPRVAKVRTTLLMDLSTALQHAKAAGGSGSGRMVKIMKIYAEMDEAVEAVRVLKSLKAP